MAVGRRTWARDRGGVVVAGVAGRRGVARRRGVTGRRGVLGRRAYSGGGRTRGAGAAGRRVGRRGRWLGSATGGRSSMIREPSRRSREGRVAPACHALGADGAATRATGEADEQSAQPGRRRGTDGAATARHADAVAEAVLIAVGAGGRRGRFHRDADGVGVRLRPAGARVAEVVARDGQGRVRRARGGREREALKRGVDGGEAGREGDDGIIRCQCR